MIAEQEERKQKEKEELEHKEEQNKKDTILRFRELYESNTGLKVYANIISLHSNNVNLIF